MLTGKAVFIHSAQLERYHYPPECPFSTDRAGMTYRILNSMGLLSGETVEVVAPEPATREELETFHTPRYLDALTEASEGHPDLDASRVGLGTPDCPVFSGMYEYAALACGATLAGARLILSGEARTAFNPSGGYHHAGPEMASGFCYLNDQALGCLALAQADRRILYLDVDAHHGDGVQNAFYDRCDVMTISLHESGRTLFPGTGFEDEIGVGKGVGYSVNVPLPVGTYDEAYMRAFTEVALPLVEAFGPDVVVMELGMDALADDPLARLCVTNRVHAEIIGRMLRFGKPLLATGGGGYHVENTAGGWALAWSVLSGSDDEEHAHAALGGVMLQTTDWPGGLRDRALAPDSRRRKRVDDEIEATIRAVKRNVFAIHGL